MGGDGGIVEIDETIYGRAATHPKGRGPLGAKLTNSAHKNVILSLVERGGNVRSYHVAGSTVGEVIPIVKANVAKEAQVMTDSAQLYKIPAGRRSPAMTAWTTARRNTRATRKAARRSTPTRSKATSQCSSAACAATYQHCKEKHLHRYLAEFDFRYNNRSALGVEDKERATKAVVAQRASG